MREYTMAKNNVQSVSYLLCTQVIKAQIIPPPKKKKPTKSVLTQTHIKKYTNIKHNIFEELAPSVLPLLKKKHIRLGHAGIVDHSID